MQFIITAYDGANMLEKRLAVRARHLENMGKVNGKVICAVCSKKKVESNPAEADRED